MDGRKRAKVSDPWEAMSPCAIGSPTASSGGRSDTARQGMKIDGLKVRDGGSRNGGTVREFRPAVEGARPGLIRATIRSSADSLFEFLDAAGDRPGIDNGETVTVIECDERIADRVVRALASLHLGIEEAETGHTPADARLIQAEFGIGRLENGSHAWMRTQAPWVAIIANADCNGLPATLASPATAIAVGPTGKKVSFVADDLDSALLLIESGTLAKAYNPLQDVLVTGARNVGKTIH